MGDVQLAVLVCVVLKFVSVAGEEHLMEFAFGDGFASAYIDVLGVSGEVCVRAVFDEEWYLTEVVGGLFGRVGDFNVTFHNAVILKFLSPKGTINFQFHKKVPTCGTFCKKNHFYVFFLVTRRKIHVHFRLIENDF